MPTNDHDIAAVERQFWTAMQSKNAHDAETLTDEDSIIVGAQGISKIGSKQMGKMTREGKWELTHFDFSNMQTRFLTDDIAIVAYTVSERVVVDGKEMPVVANDASVWVRRAGQWRCALHTESLAGDPFGRDRIRHD